MKRKKMIKAKTSQVDRCVHLSQPCQDCKAGIPEEYLKRVTLCNSRSLLPGQSSSCVCKSIYIVFLTTLLGFWGWPTDKLPPAPEVQTHLRCPACPAPREGQ